MSLISLLASYQVARWTCGVSSQKILSYILQMHEIQVNFSLPPLLYSSLYCHTYCTVLYPSQFLATEQGLSILLRGAVSVVLTSGLHMYTKSREQCQLYRDNDNKHLIIPMLRSGSVQYGYISVHYTVQLTN